MTIPDCDYLNEELRPIIPYFSKTVWLPKNTNISNVKTINETALNLGIHQIPQTVSSNIEDEIQYNTAYEFEVYPEQRIIYGKNEFEDHDELVIYYIPVSINGNTKEVTVYTETKIIVEAEFLSNISIKNFSSSKNKYGIGEPIDYNVVLLNIDTINQDIQASITISGIESSLVSQTVANLIKQSLDIESDSTGSFIWDWKTTELEPGNYSARAYVEIDDKIYGPIEKDFVVEKSIVIGAIIPASNSIFLCSQSDLLVEVQLKDSSSVNYQWYCDTLLMENYNDSILNIIDFTVEDEGGYYCLIYNELDTVSTDTIHVYKNYVFEIDEEISICEGEDYNGWMESGEYVQNLVSAHGCDSIITTNLTVKPIPNKPVITQVMDTLFSDAETGNQWYFNGLPLEGETGVKLHAMESGEYFVVASNENDCSSEQSETINFWLTSSSIITFSGIKIYPNPTNGIINIESEGSTIKQIEVYSLIGQIIFAKSDVKSKDTINISNLKKGIYIIIIKTDKHVITRKIIKN